MTTVINLYGGPGCGKSTTAALLFGEMKLQGYDVELVREAAKEVAWSGEPITDPKRLEITAEQARRERVLYGKVEFIVTDSPVVMASYYANKYHGLAVAAAVNNMVAAHYSNKEAQHEHFALLRLKKYNPKGRYQTEEEARASDEAIINHARNALKLASMRRIVLEDRFRAQAIMMHLGMEFR